MGVIVNYWLLFTPSFEAGVTNVLPIVRALTGMSLEGE